MFIISVVNTHFVLVLHQFGNAYFLSQFFFPRIIILKYYYSIFHILPVGFSWDIKSLESLLIARVLEFSKLRDLIYKEAYSICYLFCFISNLDLDIYGKLGR